MKILRVIASMNPKSGGPCQGIRNTIAAMKPLNVSNEVVCLDAPDSEYLGEDDFEIHALGPARSPWGYSNQLIPWLLENAKRFDAIIAHGMWLFPSYAVMKTVRILREKEGNHVVSWYLMPHGMLDPYFQKAADRKLKAFRNKVYWSFIEQKVVQSADAVLFTCQEELLLAKTTFSNYRPKAEWNVGYGIVPPPVFDEKMSSAFFAKVNLNLNEKYFLFLSRIHPKKGVDLLLHSYLDVLKNALNEGVKPPKLVIAGPGLESDFGEEMLSFVNSNQALKSQVLFPGMLTGNAKWGAFYKAEAFILPSHQENFGIAVAEALACGTSVLISNQINIWREIEEGNAGIIAPDTLEGTATLFRHWIGLSEQEKAGKRLAAESTYLKNFRISSNIQTLTKKISEQLAQA